MHIEDYELMKVEVRGHTAIATLQGGEGGNRYSVTQGYTEWGLLARDLRDDPEIRCLVLTASGPDEVFSLGHQPRPEVARYGDHINGNLSQNRGRQYIKDFLDLEKPVITALNGPVMSGTLTLVLLSDIIVAEEHASLADTHVTIGVPTSTGAQLWPLSVGLMKAKRWLLTGEWISAQEAERIGLVTEVVPKGASLQRALEYADKLNALDPASVYGTKRAINQWHRDSFATVFDSALALQFLAMAGDAQPYEPNLLKLQEETLAQLREKGTLH
jgi:enoyl-CoA hydratase